MARPPRSMAPAAAVAWWLSARGALGLVRSAPPAVPRLPGRRCAGGWGDFSPGAALNATQVVRQPVRPRPFGDFNPGSNYQGVFLDPQSRFAFCTIEKNGCSAWTTVLGKIFWDDIAVSRPRGLVSHKSFSKFGSEAAEQIFSDPNAVRAVMVRDPLARLASVFLDKCFAKGCLNPFCLPRGKEARGRPISFEQAVQWLLASDPSRLDAHWKLQSEHCELKDRIHEYTVVGFMDKDTFARDAACILDGAGLSRFNDDGSGRPFFLEGSEGIHQTVRGRDEEERVLKKLFTREAAQKVISHMRQDYEVFHMKEPRWVEDATGEWFAKLPQACDAKHLGKRQKEPKAATPYAVLAGEDDLFAGAQWAGYFD